MQNLPLEISLLKWLQLKIKFLKKHQEWDRPKSCLTALPNQLRVLSQFEQKDVDVLVQQLITSRLGPIREADPVNDNQGGEEYHHALATNCQHIGVGSKLRVGRLKFEVTPLPHPSKELSRSRCDEILIRCKSYSKR